MLAMNYRGPYRVRADEKPMPKILHPEDAIVRVTRSCICGSDLHLYHGMAATDGGPIDLLVKNGKRHRSVTIADAGGPTIPIWKRSTVRRRGWTRY